MSSSLGQLTFLGDTTLLLVSTLGFVCVGTAVLWIMRQKPDWNVDNEQRDDFALPWWRRLLRRRPRDNLDNREEEEPLDGALRGRTRVNLGGREAVKAARKEAKKRANAESRRSHDALAAKERRLKAQNERRRKVEEIARAEEASRRSHAMNLKAAAERSAELSLKVERYIADHKVSSLGDMAAELDESLPQVIVRVNELEEKGQFMGLMVDDAEGEQVFVRIDTEDMRKLTSFVEEKGRLSVVELMAKANMILQLTDPEDASEETTTEVELQDSRKTLGSVRRRKGVHCGSGEERVSRSESPTDARSRNEPSSNVRGPGEHSI